jgi:peptidoglycan hydrolase-like protein with peptidoglycan-binding domain
VRPFTKPELSAELERAHNQGWDRLFADAEKAKGLAPGILLAVASQETDMNDVVGDGGHGRGLFQIDDRSHRDFLARFGADRAGGKPPVAEAVKYASALLAWTIDYGRQNGVREADRLKFGLSGYNAGAGGALKGYQAGDSDARTTGADYGRSVLARYAVFQELLGGAPVKPLKRGARGKRVDDLKGKLAGWYAKHAPGEWEKLKVKPGPLYGAGMEAAVRDFQGRAGIGVDGVAGKDTYDALARG